MNHDFSKCLECGGSSRNPKCDLCDFLHCEICDCSESELLHDCPGFALNQDAKDAIFERRIVSLEDHKAWLEVKRKINK